MQLHVLPLLVHFNHRTGSIPTHIQLGKDRPTLHVRMESQPLLLKSGELCYLELWHDQTNHHLIHTVHKGDISRNCKPTLMTLETIKNSFTDLVPSITSLSNVLNPLGILFASSWSVTKKYQLLLNAILVLLKQLWMESLQFILIQFCELKNETTVLFNFHLQH